MKSKRRMGAGPPVRAVMRTDEALGSVPASSAVGTCMPSEGGMKRITDNVTT